MQTKRCPKCGEDKALDEFCRDKNSKDGRFYRCKTCCRDYVHRYYAEHPDRMRASNEKWHRAHPDWVRGYQRNRYVPHPRKVLSEEERKEHRREAGKRKRLRINGDPQLLARERERGREHSRQWRAENPDKDKASKLRTRANHPEMHRIEKENRRALEKSAAGRISCKDWEELKSSYLGRCVYCGEPADTMDHIIPLVAGGTNEPDNIVPACRKCNAAKHSRSLLMFMYRAICSLGSRQR